ncbi:MAG: sugar phosphate isomerase/epimerase, partial [Clostridia bacterium]|nr:sugar phosphate isomerase/epimerase [Clostridia bacterium]
YAPNLRATLDIKQARISGYGVYDYIEEMKGRINTVHVSDVDPSGKRALPGKGITDFYRLFSVLKDAGFDGGALIEVYKDDYKDMEELKESLEYLENIKSKIWRE